MSAKIIPQRAFVLGSTGTVGKAIVKALIENPGFSQVTLVGRRKLELPDPSENFGYSKIDQKIIDFENESSYAESFNDYDVGFCALGISSVGLTNEQYYRITHDYVMGPARLAKAGGCRHFHMVTGQSTSKTSLFYWARVKAEVEEELTQLGFDKLSIYRPAGIVKDKNEVTTTKEKAGICAFKILDPFHCMSVESLVLGKMMVDNTFFGSGEKVETLDNGTIQKLSKEFNKNQSPCMRGS